MGELVSGVWSEKGSYADKEGSFNRKASTFREKEPDFQPGRYHLYVSLACPWAHRTMIFRILKKLESAIGLTITDPYLGVNGWWFAEPEPLYGYRYVHQLYTRAESDFSGRVTVPILWDKERHTIVNNGVYRAGFATKQSVYEEAFTQLFATLDALEKRLGTQRYLCGDTMTETDWRLFTTLFRFDAVYYGHFKCNRQRIADYPNLANYLRELYQVQGVAAVCDIDQAKRNYYGSHKQINPTGIVPLGPAQDFSLAHDRGRFPKK